MATPNNVSKLVANAEYYLNLVVALKNLGFFLVATNSIDSDESPIKKLQYRYLRETVMIFKHDTLAVIVSAIHREAVGNNTDCLAESFWNIRISATRHNDSDTGVVFGRIFGDTAHQNADTYWNFTDAQTGFKHLALDQYGRQVRPDIDQIGIRIGRFLIYCRSLIKDGEVGVVGWHAISPSGDFANGSIDFLAKIVREGQLDKIKSVLNRGIYGLPKIPD